MSDLVAVLARIRQGLSQNAYVNEAAVSTQIVRPVLQELGWDVYDPQQVCPEYQLKRRGAPLRVDLALCPSVRSPQCFIEVKATRKQLKQIGQSDPDWQLFEYAFHAGVPLGLLTNGHNWHFYYMYGAGTYDDRRIRTLNIEVDPLEGAAGALDRYLSYANTKSGSAAEFAREDLRQRINRDKARIAIPRAWASLVKDDLDESLAALLINATVSHMDGEGTPTKADVASFLRNLKPDLGGKPQERDTPIGHPPPAPGPLPVPVPSPIPRAGVRYWLLGEEHTAKNAAQAYIAVFQTLVERDSEFLVRVDEKLRGRKNRGVARTKQDLSPNEAMLKSAAPLPGGWWLLTHLSSAGKIRSLKKACDAAGIRFGQKSGLKISLPNS